MWYIISNGQQVGPLQKDQLTAYNISPSTMVWREGMQNWEPAGNVSELSDILYPANPGYQQPGQPYGQPPYGYGQQQNGQQPYYGYEPKSKIAFGVLALLLGWLGIQYFYVNKTAAGLITIALSLVTCGAWELITFIQGIIVLCMDDQQFYRKFVHTNKTFPLF